jgi:voltage-gated potassium channel
MQVRSLINRVVFTLMIFFSILAYSILGYMVIEHWDFLDSLYMTVITIAGIGYGEVKPLSVDGRIHTLIVIITGVGFYSTMIVYFSSLFVEGKIRGILRLRTMEKKISNLKGHYIICGYGRIGREVCEALKSKDEIKFLVVEKDTEKGQEALDDGHLVYVGDATDDEVLLEVGIKKAMGIICALPVDALNVFITLSTRVLNPNINIIARADKAESVDKLKRAGAHMVVAPYIIGGQRMATAVTQPFVIDFLDTVLHDDKVDSKLEQVIVTPGSELINSSIQAANIRDKSGVIIIAVKKANGSLLTNPRSHDLLESGDMLIAFGNSKQLQILEKLAAGVIK